MNDQVKIFESPQFGQIRTAGTSDNPMFCLADICKVLDLNPSRVKDRLNTGGVTSSKVGVQTGVKADGTPAIQQVEMLFVNEANLYRVIMRSDKPQAEAFQDWVCGEVLPSIRKNGAYVAAQPDESPELLMARALKAADEAIQRQKQQLQEANQHIAIAEETIEQQERQLQIADGTIEQQKKQIDTLTPDADYTREVLLSSSTFTFEQVSKDLQFPSVHKFIAELKNRAIIYKQSNTWMPTSKFSGRGYFGTRTHRYFHKDGSVGTELRTVITETGRQWLHSLNLRNAIA